MVLRAVQQCSSLMVQQCNGATVQQCYSAAMQWCSSALVQQCNGAAVQWCSSACNSAMVQSASVTVQQNECSNAMVCYCRLMPSWLKVFAMAPWFSKLEIEVQQTSCNHKCDWIWENPPYGIFPENRVWCMVDKPYHRANSRSSPRPIARFAKELQRFVCDRTTPPIIEKLRSKGIAMHAYGVSVYYAYTGSQLNGPGWSC